MDEVVYSIAMCHLNNVDTVEESITSIIDQVDDRFEVVIIDDGSTDGSLDLLRDMQTRFDNLRVIKGNNDNIAEARNQSFEESKGKYILKSLDTDDKYDDGIVDFVNIYHQIEEKIEKNRFYLKGKSINMAPKSLLLEYPYRSLGYGEDRDLWRRMFADDKLIWLEHKPFYQILREEYDKKEKLKILLSLRVVDFRGGITFQSYVRWCFNSTRLYRSLWRLAVGVVAYLIAYKRGRYNMPKEMQKMGRLEEKIENRKVTLQEIEELYGIEVNKSKLSDFGMKVFYDLN